jgi:hypothetical protein
MIDDTPRIGPVPGGAGRPEGDFTGPSDMLNAAMPGVSQDMMENDHDD